MELNVKEELKRILIEAHSSPNKGNITTYRHYEKLIQDLDINTIQYDWAVKFLQQILRVNI